MPTPGPVPKHFLVFSYVRLEYYELYQNFDDIEFKNNHTTHSTIKLKVRETIVVIEKQ